MKKQKKNCPECGSPCRLWYGRWLGGPEYINFWQCENGHKYKYRKSPTRKKKKSKSLISQEF